MTVAVAEQVKPQLVPRLAADLNAVLNQVIKGKTHVIANAVTVLIAGGHLLLEDIPGVGKTRLARSMAIAIGGKFTRVQATPDLLPQDLTGSFLLDRTSNAFVFHPGPLFANVVLVDEINRATPRTQSALLEAMEERQVSVEGHSYRLPEPFFLVATQNPLEYHGTYPLPEAQLDRFMAALQIGYPDRSDELEVLAAGAEGRLSDAAGSVCTTDDFVAARDEARRVHVSKPVLEYIYGLVAATRRLPGVLLGASPRAGLALVAASQARAAIGGRGYVLPDDVKALAPHVLAHRLMLSGAGQSDHRSGVALVKKLVETTAVPVATRGHPA